MGKKMTWGSVLFLILLVPHTLWAFCGPPNLLIVLDRSGSMNNANKWKDATSAINKVTASYGKQVRFGLETFSDNATINARIPSAASVISTAMKKISPKGQTFMVKAMTTAKSHLISVLNTDSQPGRPTQILFLTDGEPSDRCPSSEVSGLRRLVAKGHRYDVKTYVIGFGALVNRVCLNDLALKGGTALSGSIRYYVANNASALVSAMKKIIQSATQSARREICDGKDNDCDGKVDENLRRTCYKLKCRGYETCSKGKWVGCNAPAPKTEVCDGKDNDCDGRIDRLNRPCSNQCGKGTEHCYRGRWGSCSATTTKVCKNNCGTGKQVCRGNRWSSCSAKPRREYCDGKDNDCDGKVDENLFRNCLPCGRQQCKSGRWGTCVKGTAQKELCNNKDDDCDGKIDEFTKPCKNRCGAGTQICRRGRWYSCSARRNREVCDGKDNDCDGQVDENLRKSCGLCAVQTCKGGRWGTCVKGTKGTEVCDGKDNDCDGKVDENLKRACKYRNCKGEQTCQRGRWYSCRPPTEVCDGKDNDCDGRVDENWSQKGKPCGAGVGVCYRTGVWICRSDKKGLICNVKPGSPTRETCDAKDNDCDGVSDENLSRSCKAKCGTGKQTCKEGSWTTCIAKSGQTGTPETCNNKDDDCDGKVDEFLKRNCKAACGSGQAVCSKGKWAKCIASNGRVPKTEVCDGKDNDCDGNIDESLARDCKTKCGKGRQLCRKGKWEKCIASGGKTPKTEVCDDKDNDCDGRVDENLKRPCKNKCGAGFSTCHKGKWGTCIGRSPKVEVCNRVDDDCDGKVDEDLKRSCKNKCGAGFSTCRGGKWSGCEGKSAKKEVCNGVDDDCDGEIDEVLQPCKTACGKGKQRCIRGDWSSCLAPQPKMEVCNGLDDDCDGEVDEGTSTCDNGSLCIKSGCRPRCRDGECARGQRCIKDFCVGLTCHGVKCSDGYRCEKGSCVDLCKDVKCGKNHLCKRGRCFPKNCYAYGCPFGKKCVDAKCIADPCAKKKCGKKEFCRAGRCVKTCLCQMGEVCINDRCSKNKCSDSSCKSPKQCQEGRCVSICKQSCHGGQFCKKGKCVHDPCSAISCSIGTVCREGHCTNRPQDPKNKGGSDPSEENGGSLESLNDGSSSGGKEGVRGVENQASADGQESQMKSDGGSVGGEGSSSSSDNGAAAGCACSKGEPAAFDPMGLLLLLVCFASFYRAKRKALANHSK